MRVLLDINVILDVLANREPFADDAEAVLQLIETHTVDGLVAAHTITTLHYLLTNYAGKAKAARAINDLLHLLTVVAVDEDRIRHALALNWRDFEDSVQAACAEKAEADYIATRDKKGFKNSAVRTLSPAELIALVA